MEMSLLYVDWNFNPVFFTLFGVDIRWYGLMWALAILIGGWFFSDFCRREGLPSRVSDSVFIYGTLATILGARIGHCLFYEPGFYLRNPIEIFIGIRNGGMASHGAAVGLLIGLWLFSRKNRLPYVWALDRIMIPVGIGGAIVRLGNLFNSEIVGCETSVPWGFRFMRLYRNLPPEAVPVQHPTQIYEALCYLITFAVLCWMYYGKDYGRRRPGVIFGAGLTGVFFTRFFVEFIKVEQEAFEKGMLLDMGQLLSIPFIVLAGWMIWRGMSRPEVDVPAARPENATRAEAKHKKSKSKRW